MNFIKTIAASLLLSLAVLSPTVTMAQNSKVPTKVITSQKYTSKVLGLSVEVPSDALKESDSNEEGLFFGTADKMYCFSAIPFDTNDLTKEQIGESYAKLAKSAKMDFAKTVYFKGKNETLDFEGDLQDFPAGGSSVVCMAVVKGTTRCFYITIVASADYVHSVHTLFRTLSFDANAMK